MSDLRNQIVTGIRYVGVTVDDPGGEYQESYVTDPEGIADEILSLPAMKELLELPNVLKAFGIERAANGKDWIRHSQA